MIFGREELLTSILLLLNVILLFASLCVIAWVVTEQRREKARQTEKKRGARMPLAPRETMRH